MNSIKKSASLIVCFLSAYFLTFFAASPLYAVKITTLYRATIPVASQSTKERAAVMPQALQQVLIKVSGDASVVDLPGIRSHLRTADTYVEEYSYLPSSLSDKPYLLQVNFDAEGIDKLLQSAKAPIWSATRPLILVLVDYEASGYATEVVSDDLSNPMTTLLKNQADQRGLAVIFPVMDVADMNEISADTVATLPDMSAFSAVVKRYGSDSILVGKVQQTTDGFTSDWKLSLGDQSWNWSQNGKTLDDILPVIVNNIANTLATRYAMVTANQTQTDIMLKVVGVTEEDDVTQLLNYLSSLTPVTNVQPMEVTENTVTLKINLRGPLESFGQAVVVGQRLTPLPAEGSLLVYQWNH